MISYSLHLSNKKHALTSTKKVSCASKHNLRQYESEEYCRDNIYVIVGGDNILDDLKKAYHQEFDDCLAEYNKGKRPDRQIDDYLKYVSENAKNDVAAELIIQLGDAEFWNDKTLETKKKMIPIFEDQIKHLEELVPDFRVISAVVHLDEHSPHIHVIGLPIGTGYKRGLQKQVAKTRVFTQESLTELQDKMHQYAEDQMNEHPEIFEGEDLKEIEKGRNNDWSKEYFVRKKAETLAIMDMQLSDMSIEAKAKEETIKELDEQVEETVQNLVQNEAQKEFMRYAFLENPKTSLGKLVSETWKKFKKWWDKHRREEVEVKARESVLGKLAKFKSQIAEDKNERQSRGKRRDGYSL